MNDSELITQVLAGDTEAYGRLIERYQRQLYYFVIGKVSESSEAQDIVQKSLVTAFHHLPKFTADAEFFPWLKGIALNHCRNEWRRHRSHATMKERLLEAQRAELELQRLEEGEPPEEGRVGALRACLQQLTPEEQALIDRRFVQELSMAEIGAELAKGSEAVRLWLYRLRVRLAECIKKRLLMRGHREMS